MRAASLLCSSALRPLLAVTADCKFVSSTSAVMVSSADLPSFSGSVRSPIAINFSTARAAARRIDTHGHWERRVVASNGMAAAPVAPPRQEMAADAVAAPLTDDPPAGDAAASPSDELPGSMTASPVMEQLPDVDSAPPPTPEASVAEAVDPAPEEAPAGGADPSPAEAPDMEAAATKPAQKIELIIDSLQNFELSKPIPVHVERLGEKKFKATVPESEVSSTGPTMGEAFLQLKDQIERSYGKYHNQKNLEPDQQRQLEALQKYVVREKRKSGWGFR
jgi:hypothetical protein